MLPDVLSVVARALGFACALQAAGIALFQVLFEVDGTEVRNSIRRHGRWLAILASALVLLHYGLEPARMAGEMAGVWEPSLQKLAAGSGTALAAGLRVAGLLLIVLALRSTGPRSPAETERRRAGGGRSARYPGLDHLPPKAARWRAWAWSAVLGAMLVAASFAATGHTAAAPHRWVLAGFLLAHLLVIEFWFGALVPLILITRHDPQAAGVTIRRFSRLATLLVPLILIAGSGMAWLLIPDLRVFREPYGELLLAKIAGFAALLLLAALNKWKLAPGLEAGDGAAARAFQRSAGAEYVVIAIVLAVTAVMTSFFSPDA